MARITLIEEVKTERNKGSFEDHYQKCFYDALTTIHLYGKLGFTMPNVIRAIANIIEAWRIDTFNADDWELITDALNKYVKGGNEIDIDFGHYCNN